MITIQTICIVALFLANLNEIVFSLFLYELFFREYIKRE